jgi:hypothetical protein
MIQELLALCEKDRCRWIAWLSGKIERCSGSKCQRPGLLATIRKVPEDKRYPSDRLEVQPTKQPPYRREARSWIAPKRPTSDFLAARELRIRFDADVGSHSVSSVCRRVFRVETESTHQQDWLLTQKD